jgi:hypothetical protein
MEMVNTASVCLIIDKITEIFVFVDKLNFPLSIEHTVLEISFVDFPISEGVNSFSTNQTFFESAIVFVPINEENLAFA